MTRQLAMPTITVHVRLRRGGPLRSAPPGWLEVTMEVPGDYTVIELVEKIKGEKDPSVVYRHSCHHGSCGTCAMRVNGEERLACITGVAEVVENGGTLTIEPLKNLPVVADLANDPAPFMRWMETLGPGHVRPEPEVLQPVLPDEGAEGLVEPFARFADCIECGSCMSACPGANPETGYIGPAPLNAAHEALRCGAEPGGGWKAMLDGAGGAHGVWQCHHVFECTRVCPANIEIAEAIMGLRWEFLIGRAARVAGGEWHG
jgi:succinate dehydrogenase / fumarate reductase iron-sulfur subunit